MDKIQADKAVQKLKASLLDRFGPDTDEAILNHSRILILWY